MEGWNPKIARDWSELYRQLIGRRQLVCRAVAMGLRRPWLAAIGFEILSRLPASAGFIVRQVNTPSSFTNASSACPL